MLPNGANSNIYMTLEKARLCGIQIQDADISPIAPLRKAHEWRRVASGFVNLTEVRPEAVKHLLIEESR